MNTNSTEIQLDLLFSKDKLEILRSNCENSYQDNHDPFPVVKLFVPGTNCIWLLTEIDEYGIGFGLCDLGMGFPELGYVAIDEIINAAPFVVVDNSFEAIAPLSVYAQKAHIMQHIVESWDDELSLADLSA